MGSFMILRALVLAAACACAASLTPLSAAGDDNDCALYLSGPGRTSAYDYSLNLLKGNFGYEGQHTCITYDAVNQAYLEARNRIVVAHPKGEWKAEDFASVGELVLDISINLARRYGLTYEEIEKGLPLIDTSRTLIRDVCPPVFSHVECRAGKYRRLDGLCNNLQNPTWGSTMAPFQRLLGPLFSDGINAPRIAHTGRDLPLSRVVSRTMHPDEGYHDHAGTVMVIAWGQFMDHDYTLTGTPLDPMNRNDPEECCNRPPHLKHPYCNEIRIPDDDYFYRLWNVKCIDFVRAFPSPRPGCRLGSRVPFNTLTGVIDGNTVYGVTDKFARKLRTGFGGLLRMNPVFKEYGLKDLLPLKLDIPDEGCTRPNKNMFCFEAGEIRASEQLVLTVMHTLMAREHNRIAKALAHVNPHWDDETLYQEARRINIAEIQHITYNEFLPILLGKDVMDKFGLVLEKEGYWDGYDPHVNPDVIDAFASAAFRFGHSLLPTAVERWSKAHKFIASKRLSDLIRRPFDLYRAGVLDEYVMGLMNQVAQAMDDSITQEVTNHLFKKVGSRFGMDLVSFNMQRGREFGIPGYMEFRKFCGLNGANSFQDLFGSMPNETVRKYETIFEHPIDVDLWSGGVSERPLPGSMLGPTFACVIATQFSYSRRGDRFWYELPNQPSSFTPEQLVEIRKARLARVICDNTDIIDTVQLYPMVLPDHELNPRVPCRSGIIPSMDFSKWAEPAPFHGAKPFVTEAFVPVQNETVVGNKTDANIESLNNAVIEPQKELVLVAKEDVKTYLNTGKAHKVTLCNRNNTVDSNCTEDASNCPKCQIKSVKSHGDDTVLKYVYKKDDKVDSSQKTAGHIKNSLRKKRSLRSASAPLIVNYTTSHESYQPQNEPTFERQINNVIKSAELADFNIETLHDAQPIKNNEDLSNTKKYNEGDSVSKSQEDEISDEKYKKESPNESSEREEYSSRQKAPSHENSPKHYERNKNYSEERSDESIGYDDKDDIDSQEPRRKEENNKKHSKYKNSKSSDESSRESNGDSSDKEKSLHSGQQNSDERSKYEERELYDGSRESNEDKRKYSKTNIDEEEKSNYEGVGDRKISPYRDNSDDNNEYRQNDSREKYGSDRKSEEYAKSKESSESNDSEDESHKEKFTRNKDKYSDLSKDSNEGRERTSEESRDTGEDSRDIFHNRDKNKAAYSTISKESSETNPKEYTNPKLSHTKDTESNEEEAIIAIMTKKRKNPSSLPNYNNYAKKEELKDTPIEIRDVDLGDFSNYERIRVNDKGIVESALDTPENYDALSTPLIKPVTTIRPGTSQDNGDQIERSRDEPTVLPRNKNDKESRKPIHYTQQHIDDEEVKPVIEFNADKEVENSKEAIKAGSNEDTSLETLLGVKEKTHDDKTEKVVAQEQEENKGDVKQQFERIPLNYNHAKKEEEQTNEQSDVNHNENNQKNQRDDTKFDQGTVDVLTPEVPVKYDEHLNIKFDDVSIKLPEIKLPDDVLAFPYEEFEEVPHKSPYVKKTKGKHTNEKDKFFHYNEHEFNSENLHDDHKPSYYSPYYGKDKHREDYKKKDHEEDDDEEEDLYEKFVRERFGKRSTFEKRSEKLTAPSLPAVENAKLFQALNQVLKKAHNIDKEAKQSGDPNAGYMWTVEYGQKL